MGAILAKFTKKKTAVEELEAIEKQTKNIEEYRRDSQQRQKRYIGALILYSIIFYIIFCIVFYFYYCPELWVDRILYSLPLLFFPFIVWIIKILLHAYFRYRITTSEEKLLDLRQQKKKILDEVKEQEKYKVAKEILEKFDPTVKEEKAKADKTIEDSIRLSTSNELRQRFIGGRGVPTIFKQSFIPGRGRSMIRNISPDSATDLMSQQQYGRPPGPPMPRPILPRERSAVDRVIEYLVGDGPSNRYALICKRCFSHNGMALKEEFDYLTYRCCYCHAVNPARKQRPSAPRLPESSPDISITPAETEEEYEEESAKVEGSLSEHSQIIVRSLAINEEEEEGQIKQDNENAIAEEEEDDEDEEENEIKSDDETLSFNENKNAHSESISSDSNSEIGQDDGISVK